MQLIASPKHTRVVVTIFIVIAVAGFLSTRRLPTTPSAASRLPLYVSVVALQWFFVRYVAAGVRRQGFSLAAISGLTSRRPVALALDVLLGVALWFALRVLIRHLRQLLGGYDDHAGALLPRGAAEAAAWIAVALTAGVCEELVFRGYLLEQFSRMMRSRAAAVAAQAVLFGISHGYQGWKPAVVITIFAVVAGVVTLARRSVLPMMVAHAITDLASGLLR